MRDQVLIQIREDLKLPVDNKRESLVNFQNKILRPILKLQNKAILSYFIRHFNMQSIANLDVAQKKISIQHYVQKKPALKYTLIGFIVGFLSTEELSVVLENKKELEKRITSMLIQRICDQLCI